MSTSWISLETLDNTRFIQPLKTSDTEWIMITYDYEFIKYNTTTKESQTLLSHSGFSYSNSIDVVSYDSQNNKYYLFSRDTLMIIDGNKSDDPQNILYKKSLNTNYTQSTYAYYDGTDLGSVPSLAFIDGKLHIIGGFYNRDHIIFDPVTQQFETVYTFDEWEKGNSGHGLVHITTTNELILFGGFDDKRGKGWMDDIWRCSLNDYKWTKSTVKLPDKICDFPYLLTNNEKYIIVMDENNVYYWNIDTTEFKQSAVKCPSDYSKYPIMMGDAERDSIMVYGFIRDAVKTMNDVLVPNDIIQMIFYWYSSEDIHIFDQFSAFGDDDSKTKHWKINICDIIPEYY